MRLRAATAGHTLIEMAVVMAIAGVLMSLAAHHYRAWIANSQIRTAAETLVEGLSAARNEAIRRNRPIGFRLVSDLSDACAVSASGRSWVVSENDPAGKCDVDVSETQAPGIVAKKSAAEGTATATIAAKAADNGDADSVIFNGVGRVVLAGKPIARIDIGTSADIGEPARVLRVIVGNGGMIRMCDPDPKVSRSDTRRCPP